MFSASPFQRASQHACLETLPRDLHLMILDTFDDESWHVRRQNIINYASTCSACHDKVSDALSRVLMLASTDLAEACFRNIITTVTEGSGAPEMSEASKRLRDLVRTLDMCRDIVIDHEFDSDLMTQAEEALQSVEKRLGRTIFSRLERIVHRHRALCLEDRREDKPEQTTKLFPKLLEGRDIPHCSITKPTIIPRDAFAYICSVKQAVERGEGRETRHKWDLLYREADKLHEKSDCKACAPMRKRPE